MAEYKSKHTGAAIDEGIDKALIAITTVEQTLTTDQQATARTNIGAAREAEYELIETIVIDTEDVKSITRNQEPNGNKYSFKKILMQLEYPLPEADYVTGAIEAAFRDTENGRIYSGYGSTYTIKSTSTQNYMATAVCSIDGGVMEGRSNCGLSITLENAQRNIGPLARYVGDKLIGVAYISAANPFLVGCKLNIWGVRA